MMAGVIDIGATWLTDLKFGLCPSAFYLNKEQCCWSSETVVDISGNCSQWMSWAEVLGFDRADAGSAGSYVVMYILYVFWAIVFASLAASLVRMFAPYACGSGEEDFWLLLIFQKSLLIKRLFSSIQAVFMLDILSQILF